MLLVVALIGVPSWGSAESLPEPAVAAIEVVLVGELAEDPVFARRISSWFDPQRFRVTVRKSPRLDRSSILSPKPDQSIHAWVVLRDPQHARLYFTCGAGSGAEATYLVRELELATGLDDLGAENITQVLRLSAVALLEGQVGDRREEVERELDEEASAPRSGGMGPASSASSAAPPKPTAPPKAGKEPLPEAGKQPSRSERPAARPAQMNMEVALGYGASWRGDEGIWHGPRVGFGIHANSGWGARALVQAALPSTEDMGDLALEFSGFMLALGGVFRHEIAPEFELEWSLGPELERVNYVPVRSLTEGVNQGDGDTELRLGAIAGVSAIIRRSSPRFVIGLESLMPFEETHYDVITGDGRRVIGRAPRILPLLSVEIRF